MIRRLRRLFTTPRPAEFPPPVSDPGLGVAPMPGTSAFHQRRAHRHGAAVHMAYRRWMAGNDDMTPEAIADQFEMAAIEYAIAATRLREEVASVDVPNIGGGDQ